jgi:metal-responsive CopG/Arc/MetJ family transcriptional regulator
MVKIAISLPDEMLQVVEAERQASGETRSEFFRRAMDEFLRRKMEREAIEQYIQGYQRYPETPEEVMLAESTLQTVLAEYPWEDDAQQ